MKRSVLFFVLFALFVAPLHLQRADAQRGEILGLGAKRVDEGIDAGLRDRLRANIDILRDTSKTPDERAKARDSVKQLLTEMFDADVTRRREQLEELQSQVAELKEQLDAQEKSRDELVELRLLLLDREISGKSAFPKGWDVLSDMTGHSNDGALRPVRPITNSIGMQLVHIPKGELTAANGKVAVADADFFLAKTEVTQGQWRSVMGTEPWKGQEMVKEGDDYPATFVSYDDAVLFCEKLSAKDGKAYRLPTEGEWEYACRAGSTAAFSFGDSEDKLGAYAWFAGNTGGEPFAHQVALKQPNAWGLYDMHGNVYEWTSSGAGSLRVVRGGGWFGTPAVCRSAGRSGFVPSSRYDCLGFRVASVPSGQPVEDTAPLRAAPGGVGTEVAPAEPRPESP